MRLLIKPTVSLLVLLVFFYFLCPGCATRPKTLVRELYQPTSHNILTNPERVKIHMNDGSLYLLDTMFFANYISDTIKGYGTLYDCQRSIVKANMESGRISGNAFIIPLSNIALLEVNEAKNVKGKALALALVSAASIGITSYCLINPKACFGSCPTFYLINGSDQTLVSEGFSSSILRIFEKDDIDMLYAADASDSNLAVRMKNEALETHIVRYANILALPREGSERIFATETGDFFQATQICNPVSCTGPEGDCLDLISRMDQKERSSKSDPHDLASKELIEITFKDIPEGDLGFIIGSRQTFMTTYLFYQTLAYLGESAGYFAARIESGDQLLRKKFDKIKDLLGGIEVFVRNDNGKWIEINRVEENGPIAGDVHLVKLPGNRTNDLKIRLRLTKGYWRIDYLALCRLEKQIEPLLVEPYLVIAEDGSNNDGATLLKNFQDPLITLPGDAYDLYYTLPGPSCEYELFLNTRGYYLEWMRESWIEEENNWKAALLFEFPGFFLKKAASDFKKVENEMEECFWNSRYVKKN